MNKKIQKHSLIIIRKPEYFSLSYFLWKMLRIWCLFIELKCLVQPPLIDEHELDNYGVYAHLVLCQTTKIQQHRFMNAIFSSSFENF